MFCFHWATFVCCSAQCRRQAGLVSTTTRSMEHFCTSIGSHLSNCALSEAASSCSQVVFTTPCTNVGLPRVLGFIAEGSLIRRTQLASRAATALTLERRSAHTSTYKTAPAFSCVKSAYWALTLLATLPAWAWRTMFLFRQRPPRALPNRPPSPQS